MLLVSSLKIDFSVAHIRFKILIFCPPTGTNVSLIWPTTAAEKSTVAAQKHTKNSVIIRETDEVGGTVRETAQETVL
jgi:hypothetical protein